MRHRRRKLMLVAVWKETLTGGRGRQRVFCLYKVYLNLQGWVGSTKYHSRGNDKFVVPLWNQNLAFYNFSGWTTFWLTLLSVKLEVYVYLKLYHMQQIWCKFAIYIAQVIVSIKVLSLFCSGLVWERLVRAIIQVSYSGSPSSCIIPWLS